MDLRGRNSKKMADYQLNWAVFQPNVHGEDAGYHYQHQTKCPKTLLKEISRLSNYIHTSTLPRDTAPIYFWYDPSTQIYLLATVANYQPPKQSRIEKAYTVLFLPLDLLHNHLHYNPLIPWLLGWVQRARECYLSDSMYRPISVKLPSFQEMQHLFSEYHGEGRLFAPFYEAGAVRLRTLYEYIFDQSSQNKIVTFATWMPYLEKPPQRMFSLILGTPNPPTVEEPSTFDLLSCSKQLAGCFDAVLSANLVLRKRLFAARKEAVQFSKAVSKMDHFEQDSVRLKSLQAHITNLQDALRCILDQTDMEKVLDTMLECEKMLPRAKEAVSSLTHPTHDEEERPSKWNFVMPPRKSLYRTLFISILLAIVSMGVGFAWNRHIQNQALIEMRAKAQPVRRRSVPKRAVKPKVKEKPKKHENPKNKGDEQKVQKGEEQQ